MPYSGGDCPVPEPQIPQFVPARAQIMFRNVRLSGGHVPERVIIFRTGGAGPKSGFIVLGFNCTHGWHEVFSRTDIEQRLEFLARGSLLRDEREQVVIGRLSSVYAVRSFMVLGWHGGRIVVLLDQSDVELPPGAFRIRDSQLRAGAPSRGTQYTWNGRGFTQTRYYG